ncbi:MAG: TetR/AcrR family transcriptional regulator [Aeromicrobium sp.]
MESSQDSTRARMSTSEDARARRTRAKLVDTFAQLAHDGRPVTVARVVKHSGVNRTSFYAHFSSLDALAVESLTELFEMVGSVDAANRGKGRNAETSERSLLDVARFIGERRAVYVPLLQAGTFHQAIEDAFTERNVQTLRSIEGLSADVDIDVTARFVAAGALGVVSAWLRTGDPAASDDLARRLRSALPSWFTA